MSTLEPTHETLSHDVKFRGTFIELSVDRVRTPEGRTVSMEIVRHPGSVVVIAMPDRDHVWLVHQHRHAVGRSLWELPAGRIESGEAPEAAADRECREEVGWRPGRLEPLGAYFATPGYCDELMMFFKASALSPCSETRPDRRDPPGRMESDEVLDARLFSVAAARRQLLHDGPTDMKTALGLAMLGGG